MWKRQNPCQPWLYLCTPLVVCGGAWALVTWGEATAGIPMEALGLLTDLYQLTMAQS